MFSRSEPQIDRAALASGIAVGVVGVVLLLLHILLLLNSGAFWRDECSSILLAQAPSWQEMWNHLAIDSFPGLFVDCLRVWIQSGLGASDFGIRLLGILISLGMLFSVFQSCRVMQVRFPLLALCLAGLNSVVFFVGSSIRAYGLAALLIVACLAAFWRVAVQPTRCSTAAAFLLAVLSVHCNYQNSYLLFGIGVAAAAVAAMERKWMRSGLVLVMCFVAALSMAVYLPAISHYRSEIIVSNYRLSMEIIVATLLDTMAANGPWLLFGWFAGFFALVYVVAKGPREPSPGLYCLLAIVIAAVAGATFFKIGAMHPFPWHYIPFVAVCAVAIECGIADRGPGGRLALGKILLACYVAAVSLPAACSAAHLRRTNMDRVAATLEEKSRTNDLILVEPYWLRPSFLKYYHGAAPWRIVPVDPDDPGSVWLGQVISIKNIMAKPNSIQPTLDLVRKTLQGGGNVWIVGYVSPLPDGAQPPKLIPAPHPDYGWDNKVYSALWSQCLSCFLRAHAEKPESLVVRSNRPVDNIENVPLLLFHGWRDRKGPAEE